MSGRSIVANLDGEAAWARAVRGAAPALSGEARRLIAGLGATLRVFAEEGDALVLAAPIDPSRLPPPDVLPELPEVHLADRPAEGDEVLAWAETEEVARARRGRRRHRAADDPAAPLAERVWTLPAAAPAVAAEVNFRGFQRDTAAALGCGLEGARIVESVDALRRHLDGGGASASPDGRCVLKAAWSAAGRARVVLRPGDDLAPAARLLERWGALLFEPWMARDGDFGAIGAVTDDGAEVLGIHAQAVDEAGRFRGLTVLRGLAATAALGALDRMTLEETARAVGDRLHDADYRGPFGIDAWTHVVDGRRALHPLGEINARLTMGFVAHAAVERLSERFPDDANVSLAVGRGAPPDDAVPLLLPGPDDPTSAWLTAR